MKKVKKSKRLLCDDKLKDLNNYNKFIDALGSGFWGFGILGFWVDAISKKVKKEV